MDVRCWIRNPDKVIPQLLVAIGASWGYFCMGTVRGWSSPGIPSLNRTLDFEMLPDDMQWISSFPMIGAMIGSLLVNKPMQYFGRKKTLIFHYLFFIAGFSLTGFTYFGKNKSMLYVGRFLMGFGAGCTTPASQIYVSECASPRVRGRLGSLTASSLSLGIWVTYIIGTFVEWQVLSWIFACLPILFLINTAMMPESPVWLLENGREDEARRSLQRLRGKKTNIEAEVMRMKEHNIKVSAAMQNKTNLANLFTGPVLRPLAISLGLMLFQQTTGINAIIFYTVSIFKTAGSTIDERFATIVVGAVQLIFTIASGFFVDRCGRRVLFISSAMTSSLALTTMGTYFHFQRSWGDHEASKHLGWLPLVSLIVFFITYSAGVSNVPFIIMGEMFPSCYRSLLGAISSSFHLFCTFVMVRFFPDMLRNLGKDGTFYFFTGCTLFSAIFVYIWLPETKGKTLEEMEQLFKSKRHHRDNVSRKDIATISSSSIIHVNDERYQIQDVVAMNDTNSALIKRFELVDKDNDIQLTTKF